MKKIVLLALALILALSFAACGGNTGSDNSEDNVTSSSVVDDGDDATPTDTEPAETLEGSEGSKGSEATGETTRPPASAELSPEWDSFQFDLEGVIYTLPIRYSELEANGWVAQNEQDLEETLEPDQYIAGYITLVNSNKENSEISAQFANLDDEDMLLHECYVSGIQFAEYSWSEDTVLYFPGGFTIGSTMEEVEALYGEPSETSELSATVDWKYQTEIYDGITITFTKETGEIEKLRMTNLYLP